jgi:hypothetical protein
VVLLHMVVPHARKESTHAEAERRAGNGLLTNKTEQTSQQESRKQVSCMPADADGKFHKRNPPRGRNRCRKGSAT